jgi:hypothetical protein
VHIALDTDQPLPGLEKVQFQVGIRALIFNLKRVIALGVTKIEWVPA